MAFVFLSDWLVSLSIIVSSSFHVVPKSKSPPHPWFYSHVVFHCANVPQLFYPLIYRWAPGLLPNLALCKQCCSAHKDTFILSKNILDFFIYNPTNGITVAQGSSVFNFSKKLHTVFQWLHQSAFTPIVYECFLFSTSSPTILFKYFQL